MSVDFDKDPSFSDKPRVTKEHALGHLRSIIDNWDFNNPLAESLNGEFALNIAHWVLENFGRQNDDGEFFLFPDYEGFAGEELPDELRQLVIFNWGNELLYSGQNTIRLASRHVYYEKRPEVPQWEEIRGRFKTYHQTLDYIKKHPEIISGIKRREVDVLQQVDFNFDPHFGKGWGLGFLVNRNGVYVMPYGSAGKTRVPTEYVLQYHEDQAVLTKTICELSVLAARHVSGKISSLDPDCLGSLKRRLDGDEPIPLCLGNFQPNPADAIVDLIIKDLYGD